MSYVKPSQKIVSFTNDSDDLSKITTELKKGWSIVYLAKKLKTYNYNADVILIFLRGGINTLSSIVDM